MPIKNVGLLHYDARSHTAKFIEEKLAEKYWKPLKYPPCNFYLLYPMKEAMGDNNFEDDDGVAYDATCFILQWDAKIPN